jgi:hypothetical protein
MSLNRLSQKRGPVQKLWSTDLAYLNDTSEYSYADTVMDKAFGALKVPTLLSSLASALKQTPDSYGLRIYAACLCETDDLLSQWRAYCKDGTGYAIGFNFESLHELFADPTSIIGRVIYEEERQTTDVGRILKVVFGRLDEAAPGAMDTLRRLDASQTNLGTLNAALQEVARLEGAGEATELGAEITALVIIRAFLKDRAFSEEQEWRIVSLGPPFGEKFREFKGLLVPYIEIPEIPGPPRLPIASITIGPGPHPKQAHDALKRFLDQHQFGHIPIRNSPIPVLL